MKFLRLQVFKNQRVHEFHSFHEINKIPKLTKYQCSMIFLSELFSLVC